MNTANVSNIMLATIIIDVNGQIRTLAAGETPKPGEVIVELGEDLTSSEGIQVQLVETSGEANNISVDNEIAQLIEQIQAGEDPTQNPDLATAAGQNGSSPTGTGTVERTGAELLASTSFDTSGLESQGLSETQSLSLLELVSESLVVFEGTNLFEYFENSSVDDVLAVVNLESLQGEVPLYSIEFQDGDPLEGLFEINAQGEIHLTQQGVDSFANDFELDANQHTITVLVTAGEQVTPIEITLNELDVDEPPVFVPPTEGDSYVFSYNENSLDSTVIGQVSATDPEAQTVSYSIAYGESDPLDGLFEINAEGEISLTAAGVTAFTNDYELASNIHNITVVATDPAGNSSQIAVTLNEININERPLAENFSVDIVDQDIVPIVFDTTGSDDHISDVDDDMLGNQVMVMLTSLPDAGTLLYTEGGVTREITESDLYDSQSGYLETEFDPNFISYVPGSKNLFTFGDSDHSNMEDGQWGDPNEDNTVRTYTLDNDNVITLWITDQNGKPATFHLYKNENANDGYGLADNDGNGINGNGGQSDNGHETFHIDLAQNPLDVVYFGIDGVGGAQNGNSDNSIMVTYHLYDGNSETVNYEKPDGDVGNQQLSYEFSYSSPDNPIIGIEMAGDGGSWVLSYFSGAEALPDETSFTYVAIDSGVPVDENNTQTKLISDEATVTLDTSDAPSYNVFSAENGDSLNGQLGNDVLIGDEQANIFTWLDSTLDSGRDVIVDFELGNDKVDLLDILSDSPSTQEFNALIDSISVSVSGDNVELEVPINQDDSQTIVFENGASLFDSYIDSGAITQQNDLLNALLKDPSS